MNYTLRNLLVAALLMLIGIVAVISFIRGERQDLSRGKQEVQVFVAAKDIPEGTPADELESGGFLDTKDVLREDAPPQAVGKMETIEQLVSNQPIYAGEIVSYTAFDKTAGLKPTAKIKGNERLFAVPVEAANDAAGLIRVGDRIDIFSAVGSGNDTVVAVIARDVEVIETPQTLVPDGLESETAAPEADGDTKLYVLKATDKEAMNIKVALANSGNNDGDSLMFLVRPSNGDAETKIPPQVPWVATPTTPPSATEAAPDPAVR
jgi:Flp pilus assembly protein CpaB